MDINDTPIEIVDHLSDIEKDVVITEVTKNPNVYFKPLTDDDRILAAMKFNLVIKEKVTLFNIMVWEICIHGPQLLHSLQRAMYLVSLTVFHCS